MKNTFQHILSVLIIVFPTLYGSFCEMIKSIFLYRVGMGTGVGVGVEDRVGDRVGDRGGCETNY